MRNIIVQKLGRQEDRLRVINYRRDQLGISDLLWGGIREYCYPPFVIRNSPLRISGYWVSRVSLGAALLPGCAGCIIRSAV